MAVTTQAQIRLPVNSPVLPASGIQTGQWNQGVEAGRIRPWYAHATAGTGDLTGGAATLKVSTRPSAGRDPLYVAVTHIVFRTDDVGTGNTVKLDVGSADFDLNYIIRLSLDVPATADLWTELVTPDRPLYYGAVVPGSLGDLQVIFAINTNTKAYNASLRGWLSDRPFLVPRSLVP